MAKTYGRSFWNIIVGADLERGLTQSALCIVTYTYVRELRPYSLSALPIKCEFTSSSGKCSNFLKPGTKNFEGTSFFTSKLFKITYFYGNS